MERLGTSYRLMRSITGRRCENSGGISIFCYSTNQKRWSHWMAEDDARFWAGASWMAGEDMSFDAFAWALRMDLPCPEKTVLAMLCHYASDDNRSCWASITTLAFSVGVSEQTVRNKIKTLVEKGFIERVIERQGRTTIYVLDFEKIAQNAQPRPLNVVDPSTWLTPQRGRPHPSTTLTPPLNDVDPINKLKTNNKQSLREKAKTRPSKEDVLEYAKSQGKVLDPITESERFFDYYESNGWKVGKNSMKDWRAAWRNWESRAKQLQPAKSRLGEGVSC